ncbi:MAG: hypothetical protein D6B27_04150, partial [Gammaproteobacteria bacterium]
VSTEEVPTLDSVIKSNPLNINTDINAKPDNKKITVEKPAIKISRTRPTEQINRLIENGYREFTNGNTDLAYQLYTRALLRDSNNIDAMLGLAAIETINNNNSKSEYLYKKVMELDPNNQTAKAALANITVSADSIMTESTLKIMLQQSPDNPQIYFNLGIIYLQEGRLVEAMQMFNTANEISPENPDTLLNIAICHDRYGELDNAIGYYQLALNAASRGNSSFNRHEIETYLQQLIKESRTSKQDVKGE